MKSENKCSRKLEQMLSPQQTAIAGGSLLMFNSGIHIGYGFIDWKHVLVAWTDSIPQKLITLVVISWFVGSIVGFVSAPIASKYFSKKTVYVTRNTKYLNSN